MNNKYKSAKTVSKFIHVFNCPFCHSPMKVTNLKSLVCLNNHTFDIAKQGYVNMLTRSTKSYYDKELFKARQKIIMESDLYALLHEKISEVINERIHASNSEFMILDAGCGEGSHLQRIIKECKNETITGIGLDISKEGIRMAASNYKESIWLVGDLANLPLADQACNVILNILSPANYIEFKRALVPDGIVIKVVPSSNYLKELREALFYDADNKVYKNDETVELFKKHFHLVDVFNLSYIKELSQIEFMNLVQMSPLSWNSKKEHIDQLANQGFPRITIDLDIMVGINKLTKGGGM